MAMDKQHRMILQLLAADGVTAADCIAELGVSRDDNPYSRAAHELYGDSELSVDPQTVVSEGDDPGAWVLCWRWISDKDVVRLSNRPDPLTVQLTPTQTAFLIQAAQRDGAVAGRANQTASVLVRAGLIVEHDEVQSDPTKCLWVSTEAGTKRVQAMEATHGAG